MPSLWRGRRIGTIGRAGCFSFQSYKLVNAGEGGIVITDDADLVARAVIMSGAYEHNWAKHMAAPDPALEAAFARWQNRLPLYNLRLSNLSAAIIRAPSLNSSQIFIVVFRSTTAPPGPVSRLK